MRDDLTENAPLVSETYRPDRQDHPKGDPVEREDVRRFARVHGRQQYPSFTYFTRHHNLSHMMMHSQEKLHECQKCHTRYQSLKNLELHTRLKHGEATPMWSENDGEFARWLRTGEPKFWISGRAGSGKSCLTSLIS
jgi:hypothetical protein